VLLAVADVRRAWNRYPLSGMEGTPLVAELKETGLDVTALAMFYDDLVHVEPACDAHLAAVLLAASSPPDDSRARELLRQWIQRTGELMRNRLVGTQAAGVEALAVLGEAPPPEELRRLHIGRDLAAAKTGLQTAAATLRREYTAEAQRLGFQHRAMVEMGKQLRKTDLSSFRAQIDAALAVGENDPQEEVIAKALALRAFSRRDAAQRAWAQFGEMFAARDPEADRYARIARQFNRELERLKVDFGVYVVRVADAEPAQAGGLTPGDIIIACDGRPVESFRLFLAADGAPAGNKPREVVVLRLGPSGAFSRQTLRIRALPPSDALLPI